MSKVYKQYVLEFRNKSTAKGLGYTLKRAFSAIPGGIGHIIDTLFGLQGTIYPKDNNANLCGPFGLLLGGIPALVGYVLGTIIHYVLNISGYVGHGFDSFFALFKWSHIAIGHAISRFCDPIRNAFVRNSLAILLSVPLFITTVGHYIAFAIVYCFEPIYLLFTSLVYKPPAFMEMPLGFITGFVPEIARFIVSYIVLAHFTAVIKKITDTICDGIMKIKRKIIQKPVTKADDTKVSHKKTTDTQEKLTQKQDKSQKPAEATANAAQPKPKRRIHRSDKAEEARKARAEANKEKPTLIQNRLDACEEKLDLYLVIGITPDDKVDNFNNVLKKAFLRQSALLHPDKAAGFPNKFKLHMRNYQQTPETEPYKNAKQFFARIGIENPSLLIIIELSDDTILEIHAAAYKRLLLAQTILSNTEERRAYNKWYDANLRQPQERPTYQRPKRVVREEAPGYRLDIFENFERRAQDEENIPNRPVAWQGPKKRRIIRPAKPAAATDQALTTFGATK